MEAIQLDLSPQPWSRRRVRVQAILFALVGLSNVVQAYLVDNDFRFVNLIAGVFIITVSFAYPLIYKSKWAIFDDTGMNWTISNRRNLVLGWSEVSFIEASTFLFSIHTKDSRLFTIDLGNITFEQHTTVKPKIVELARSKGVELRMK